MSTEAKTAAIAKFFLHHMESGMTADAAVAHISTGLGLSRDAVIYATRPVLEAGVLAAKAKTA